MPAEENLEHHTATVNGVRLHYVTAGSGPALVLLHGWTQTWYSWRRVLPALAEHYTVVAPDLRGLGDSEKPAGGYDTGTVAHDLHELVRHLDLDEVLLAAHDIGGWVAYAYAALHPTDVRALVLMETMIPGLGGFEDLAVTADNPVWHPAFHTARDVAELLVAGKEREYLSYFYRTYAYDTSAISADDVDEYVRCYSAPGGMRAGFEYYRAFFDDVRQNRELARTKLTMPVLALGGRVSVGNGLAAALEDAVDDLHAEVVDRCGHFVADERPAYLVERLLRFFSDTGLPTLDEEDDPAMRVLR